MASHTHTFYVSYLPNSKMVAIFQCQIIFSERMHYENTMQYAINILSIFCSAAYMCLVVKVGLTINMHTFLLRTIEPICSKNSFI